MADEELRFRATGTDAGAGRMFDHLGDKADGAAGDVKGLDRQLDKLDEQLDLTKVHLGGLIQEFKETGNLDLLKGVRKDRSLIRQLENLKSETAKLFGEVADEAGDGGVKVGRAFGKGMSATLGALPSQLKGAAIASAVAIGASMAPFIGAAVGGAVLGGVGAGGLIGGIALAAQDSRVEAAGKGFAERFSAGLRSEAAVFVHPLVNSLELLQDPADDLTATLGRGFAKVAPLTGTIARNLERAEAALEPGLDAAFEASIPVLRVLAKEMPEVADAISDALKALAEESDGAAEGVAGLSNAIEFAIRRSGEWVGFLGWLYDGLVDLGAKAREVGDEGGPLGWLIGAAAGPATGGWLLDELSNEKKALEDAKSSAETYVGSINDVNSAIYGTVQAATEARGAMVKYQESITAQFDPMADLIQKIRDVRDAQKDYNEAVKEHGPKSDEARDANLRLAGAVLALNEAAAGAAGTFNGTLPPALRETLKAGGLTEAQIKDIEKQFKTAAAAGAAFAKTYTAKAVLDARQLYGSLAAANNALSGSGYVSGRASGGDVKEGRTYLVGERGPELVTFGENGYVHNANASQQMISGASGGAAQPWGGRGDTWVATVRAIPSGNALIDYLLGCLQVEIERRGGDVQVVLGSSTLKA